MTVREVSNERACTWKRKTERNRVFADENRCQVCGDSIAKLWIVSTSNAKKNAKKRGKRERGNEVRSRRERKRWEEEKGESAKRTRREGRKQEREGEERGEEVGREGGVEGSSRNITSVRGVGVARRMGTKRTLPFGFSETNTGSALTSSRSARRGALFFS